MPKGEKVASAYVEIKADVDKLKKDLKNMKGNVNKEGKKAGKAFGSMFAKGFAALGVGALLVSTLRKSITSFRGFEKAMRNVASITNMTNAEFKQLSGGIRDLAVDVGGDATDLANSMYQAVSAGVDLADSLEFISVAARAGIAGLASTETAVDGMTTVMNSWGMSAQDATRISDIMFQTVKLGKTTFEELSASLSTVASIAASAGVSFEQVSSAVATLTAKGVPTAVAMTGIRAAILSMNKELGDGWSKTMTFNEAAKEMEKRAGGSAVKLQEMTGRVEAMAAILNVTGNNAKAAADAFAQFEDTTGATAKALSEQMKTLDFKMNQLSAATEEFYLNIGEGSKGAISNWTSMVQWAGKLYKNLSLLSTGTWTVDLSIAGAGAFENINDEWEGSRGVFRKGRGDLQKLAREIEELERLRRESGKKVVGRPSGITSLFSADYEKNNQNIFKRTNDSYADFQNQQVDSTLLKVEKIDGINIKSFTAIEEQQKESLARQQEAFNTFVLASAQAFDAAFADIGVIMVQSSNVIVNAFTGMANAIIGQIKRMIAQWLAWQAITGLFSLIGGGGILKELTNPTDIFGFNDPVTPSVPTGKPAQNRVANGIDAINENLISSGGNGEIAVQANVVGEIENTVIKLSTDRGAKQIARYR